MNNTLPSIYDFVVRAMDGRDVPLESYRGRVLLIVNVASKCGFTPQYAGLQSLHDKYSSQGFSVLGFPCNQFGGQEPGTNEEIRSFCSLKYEVTFDVFSKVNVNGPDTVPLYEFLKTQSPGLLGSTGIKWNFTKFLVGRQGQVLDRYGSMTPPSKLESDIEKALAESA